MVQITNARRGLRGLLAITAAGVFAATVLVGCAGEAEKREIQARLQGPAEGRILPQREDYYGVEVVDADHVWLVGSYGTILNLRGGAETAALQHAPTHAALFCVSFNGTADGLIGGEHGLVLRTTDGGAHWSAVALPDIKQNIVALARGTDRNQVWGVGPFGTMLHSGDGGATWENLSLGRDVTLNGVTFINDHEGWIVGEFGTILYTRDGGHTWEERHQVSGLPKYVQDVDDEEARRHSIPRLEEEDLYLFAVAFNSPTDGYIAGAGGFVLHTTDGGQNWALIKTGTRNTLFSLALLDQERGIATGVLGTVVRQRGAVWETDRSVSEHLFTWVRAVAFARAGVLGVAAGGNGTVLISHDQGSKWTALRPEVLARAVGDNAAPAGAPKS